MLMYGISSKFMIIGSFSFSNHHGRSLPDDFIENDGSLGPHVHGIHKGESYAYKSESYALGFRYRFFNRDATHFHSGFFSHAVSRALYRSGLRSVISCQSRNALSNNASFAYSSRPLKSFWHDYPAFSQVFYLLLKSCFL